MFKRNLPLMVTIMVFLVGYLVCLASFPAFLSTRIICNILTDNAFLGIVAVGMTFVILSGGIDLSVGAVIAFTGVLIPCFCPSATTVPEKSATSLGR